jgi:hypothetical protein
MRRRCLMLSYWWSQVVVSCFPIGGHKSLSHDFLLAVTSRCFMLSYWQSKVVVSCFSIGSHKSLSHAFLLAVTSRCLMPSYWQSQVVVSCFPIGSHKSLSKNTNHIWYIYSTTALVCIFFYHKYLLSLTFHNLKKYFLNKSSSVIKMHGDRLYS